MLDLFCGRFGWGRAFSARGWDVTGIDIIEPMEVPKGCEFIQSDVLEWRRRDLRKFDFICASTPCEQFSLHGMKHFHPNPPHPDLGIKLFSYTQFICDGGPPYVMENVRAAQQFVGRAVNHAGPFYLWGNAVPPLLPQGITKGTNHAQSESQTQRNNRHIATIPPALAACVAEYAEALIRQKGQP